MKLKAIDTMHVSSVKADNILPGEEFEVSDDFGKQFVERNLATEVGKSRKVEEPKSETKADKAPLNKMDIAPANKSLRKKGK